MAFAEQAYKVDIVGGSSNIATTNFFPIAPPAQGMWAVWADVLVTTAGSAGTVAINVGWNNGVTAAGLNSTAFSLNAQGEQAALVGSFYAVNTTPITYSTTVSGASGGPIYTIRLRLQFLG